MHRLPRPLKRIFVVTAIIYAYFVGGYLNNTMTNSIGALTIALVEDQSLRVDAYAFNKLDISEWGGHLYSGMPPGLSLLLVPVYMIEKYPMKLISQGLRERLESQIHEGIRKKYPPSGTSQKRLELAVLLVLGVLLLAIPMVWAVGRSFYRILVEVFPDTQHSIGTGLLIFLLLGSPLADFSATLFHTTVGAVILWLVFANLMDHFEKDRGFWESFGWGWLLFFVASLDYPAVIYSGIMGAAFFVSVPSGGRLRFALPFLLGAVISLGTLAAYHYLAFGSPFLNAYQTRALPITYALPHGLTDFIPTWSLLRRTLVNPLCGILIYNPIVFLGLIIAPLLVLKSKDRRSRLFWSTSLLMIVANLYYYTIVNPHANPAGGSFGARYTVYSLPFALLACVPIFNWIFLRVGRWILWALLGMISIPTWMYLFYGSPSLTPARYLKLLTETGPAGYTIFKMYEAGWVNGPLLSWIGLFGLMLACGLVMLVEKNKSRHSCLFKQYL
jgi:hypothetical protein